MGNQAKGGRGPAAGRGAGLELRAPLRAARRRNARAGFTLVEVMTATVILAVAISGLSGSILLAMSLNRVNRDTALAQQGARRTLEVIEGRIFAEVFAAYNRSVADDGGVAGATPGANFAVPGLQVRPGDADGMCGRVMFPAVVAGGIDQLREDSVDAALGVPRDLNGDAVVDAVNHAADYTLLPVRVRIEWQGVSGPRQLDIETILSTR